MRIRMRAVRVIFWLAVEKLIWLPTVVLMNITECSVAVTDLFLALHKRSQIWLMRSAIRMREESLAEKIIPDPPIEQVMQKNENF